jgi:hypothetical protein
MAASVPQMHSAPKFFINIYFFAAISKNLKFVKYLKDLLSSLYNFVQHSGDGDMT